MIIKPFEPENVDVLERWYYSGDHEDFFVNTLMLTREQLKVYSYMKDGQGFMIWSDSGQPMGFISLYDMRVVSANVKVGILIDTEYRKSKTGYEAMKFILDYCFNRMNFQKVIAEVLEINKRVVSVIENGGFKKECVLNKEVKFKGKFYDVFRYCLFADDFNKGMETGYYK